MAGDSSHEDRTEAATPRRLQKARDEGQVPVSRELVTFAGLAAVALAMLMSGPSVTHGLVQRLGVFLERTHQLTPGPSVAGLAARAFLGGATPFVLAAMISGVAVVLVQTRFLLSTQGL